MSIEGFNGEENYYPRPASNKHKGDPMSNLLPQEPPRDNPYLTPCELCGIPTAMLGTKRCHPCWQLEQGIAARPVQARQLLGVATLVAQRDRSATALTTIRDSYWSENEPYPMRVDQLQDIARDALAAVEQADGLQAGGGSEGEGIKFFLDLAMIMTMMSSYDSHKEVPQVQV